MGSVVTISSALLCDEVRREDNGKFLVIGVYRSSILFSKYPAQKGFFAFVGIHNSGLDDYTLGFSVHLNRRKIQEQAGEVINVTPGHDWIPVPITPVQFEGDTNFRVMGRVGKGRWRTLIKLPVRLQPNSTS